LFGKQRVFLFSSFLLSLILICMTPL